MNRFAALVAERSMLSATDPKEMEALDGARTENLGQAEDRWNQYKALPLSKEEDQAIAAYEAARAEWHKSSDQVAALLAQGTAASREAARALSTGSGND